MDAGSILTTKMLSHACKTLVLWNIYAIYYILYNETISSLFPIQFNASKLIKSLVLIHLSHSIRVDRIAC